jgi:hypothetical protein
MYQTYIQLSSPVELCKYLHVDKHIEGMLYLSAKCLLPAACQEAWSK